MSTKKLLWKVLCNLKIYLQYRTILVVSSMLMVQQYLIIIWQIWIKVICMEELWAIFQVYILIKVHFLCGLMMTHLVRRMGETAVDEPLHLKINSIKMHLKLCLDKWEMKIKNRKLYKASILHQLVQLTKIKENKVQWETII